MALNPSTVVDLAEDLLHSVATRLADNVGGPGLDVPARQYVHSGEVALDCEQLVVNVVNLNHAMPGGTPIIATGAPPRHVAIDVWLIRCVPTQDDNQAAPTAAKLNVAGEALLTDLWCLAYELWAGFEAEEWGQHCAAVLFGLVEAVGPAGAYGGSHAQLFVQVL